MNLLIGNGRFVALSSLSYWETVDIEDSIVASQVFSWYTVVAILTS